MKYLAFALMTVMLVSGCRQRQPEAASGVLDADRQVTLTCIDVDGVAWGISVAGWNYGVGEALPVVLTMNRVGAQVLTTRGVIHYAPEEKLIAIFKEGGLQTEYRNEKYVGILEIAGEALNEVTCQL